MYRRILVANDGSAGALKALDAALALAKASDAALHMVTVEELPRFAASIDEIDEEKRAAHHRLRSALSEARARAEAAGVELEVHLLSGHVVASIVEFVKQHRIELLVVGFMGHSRLYERVIGSTTDRLVDLAPCTVLVVK